MSRGGMVSSSVVMVSARRVMLVEVTQCVTSPGDCLCWESGVLEVAQ